MSDMVPTGSKYTDEDRQRAAIAYAIHGHSRKVAETVGIPYPTIRTWKRSDWWPELVQQARVAAEDRFRGACHRIVERATEGVLDRLENGEEVHTKDGIKHKMMSGKDVATVGAIYYDKLRLSLNLPTSISQGQSTNKAIQDLASQFRQLSESFQARDINVVSVQQPVSGTEEPTTK